jgi:hypothetical protein
MRRTLALFGAGVALGAVAMYFAGGDAALSSDSARLPARSSPETDDTAARALRSIDFVTLATKPAGTSERAALLRLAAEADRRTIESLATQVAALPNIEGRQVALEALLARYAEIDAPAAAAFARELGLPPAVLKPLYATWARRDAREALRALGDLDARPALPLGIAILEVLGNDSLGVARVLGAAPQIDADRFRIEAALAKAAQDPAAALEDILQLPPSKARTAFERLAVVWVESDVHAALAAAEEIADETLRNELKSAVMRAWTYTDPDALLDYVADLDPEDREQALRTGGLQAFALVDPQRALRAAEDLPGELGAMLKRTALMTLARDDPLGAISLAESLPAGNDREQMLSAIATSYGRTDPDAALAWAQSLSPPSPNVVANVLAGLARVNPDRAIDLLLENLSSTEQRGFNPMMSMAMTGALDAEHNAKLADRLLAKPNRQALQMMTQMWAQRQPHDALRWLLANSSSDMAPRMSIGQAAAQLARTDPAAAISYLSSVPQELRATWISAVADGYSQNDARAAANWIAQHRGEPGYDAAVAAIAARTAASDPSTAARLFDSINHAEAPDAPQASASIAASWARRDPNAAADWAAAIDHDIARESAVAAVTAQWATRDAAGARGWALGLPEGSARDRALTQLLSATSATVDAVLVDAYSDTQAQQRGIGEAVRTIAMRDPAAARRIADQYITDPGVRQSTERFLEQNRNGVPFMGPPPPRLPPGR